MINPELREIVDEHNSWVDEFNRNSDEQHRQLEKELGYPIQMSPHLPHVPYTVPETIPASAEDDDLFLLSGKSGSYARVSRYDDDRDPFLPSGGSLKPGSAWAKRYAEEEGPSGMPRWMEPFSKVDLFGNPTVFSNAFGRSRNRR